MATESEMVAVITDSLDMSFMKLREIVMEKPEYAAINGVTKSWTRFND